MTNIAQTKEKNMALPVNNETMSVEERNRLAFEQVAARQAKQTESPELNKLMEALAKAQMDMDVAATDSVNPFFKSRYADLASVVKASRPVLAKNGLSVIQRTLTAEDGKVYMHARLCHSSGQWIESVMEVRPPKADIQALGSHLTYLRRYLYSSLVGVVTSDEDDDGEVAMKAPRSGKVEEDNNGKISKAQLQVLSQELSSSPELVENILKGFNISKLADLPSKKYTGCIERIRDIKRAKEA